MRRLRRGLPGRASGLAPSSGPSPAGMRRAPARVFVPSSPSHLAGREVSPVEGTCGWSVAWGVVGTCARDGERQQREARPHARTASLARAARPWPGSPPTRAVGLTRGFAREARLRARARSSGPARAAAGSPGSSGVAAIRIVLPLPGEGDPVGQPDLAIRAVYRVDLTYDANAEAEAPARPGLEHERLRPDGPGGANQTLAAAGSIQARNTLSRDASKSRSTRSAVVVQHRGHASPPRSVAFARTGPGKDAVAGLGLSGNIAGS